MTRMLSTCTHRRATCSSDCPSSDSSPIKENALPMSRAYIPLGQGLLSDVAAIETMPCSHSASPSSIVLETGVGVGNGEGAGKGDVD